METSAAAAQDWSALPVDLLLIAMSSMEVPDVVHTGAVCTSWRSAYAAFRALRLPTPRQPPCLLYYARGGADGPGTPTLYSPSTITTFRVPLLEPCGGVICSAHGWLLVTDKAANPYLLNPLTGARAALPPITTLERVKSSFVDAGGVVYNVDYSWGSGPDMRKVTAQRAQDWMFHRAAISASPVVGKASCVVLLVHMPYEELSFARPGDDRWTSLSDLLSPLERGYIKSVAYSEKDGLFYVLQTFGSLHLLDLNGPSPVARPYACMFRSYSSKCTPYLVPLQSGGGVLVVTRCWRRSGESPEERRARSEVSMEKHKYVITTDIQLRKIDPDRLFGGETPAGPGDHALFLGSNSALYLPVRRLPVSLSKPDCAYLTDDVDSDTFHSSMKRLDLGVWDFEVGSMKKLGDVWPLHPWLDCPAPIWITPSLC